MSTDFYLVSDTEAIHVAQDGLGGFTFYSAERDCMTKLGDFLQRNQNKALRFMAEQHVYDQTEDGSIVEIEWKSK